MIRRGDVYLVSFDPTASREIKKTRPALIIQNDVGNQYSKVTIVAAVTSKVSAAPYPIEVTVEPTKTNGLQVKSAIRLDQVRTIDRLGLIKRLGQADTTTMQKVNRALKISLGLVDF